MELKLDPSGEAGLLTLDGELTIERAAELKEQLTESMQRAGHVVIQLQDVTAVDLTCLQLFCSAHRTSFASGKQVTLEGQHAEVFQKTVVDTGFARKSPCALSPNNRCFWIGG